MAIAQGNGVRSVSLFIHARVSIFIPQVFLISWFHAWTALAFIHVAQLGKQMYVVITRTTTKVYIKLNS
jgi:hypothetical protein